MIESYERAISGLSVHAEYETEGLGTFGNFLHGIMGNNNDAISIPEAHKLETMIFDLNFMIN